MWGGGGVFLYFLPAPTSPVKLRSIYGGLRMHVPHFRNRNDCENLQPIYRRVYWNHGTMDWNQVNFLFPRPFFLPRRDATAAVLRSPKTASAPPPPGLRRVGSGPASERACASGLSCRISVQIASSKVQNEGSESYVSCCIFHGMKLLVHLEWMFHLRFAMRV